MKITKVTFDHARIEPEDCIELLCATIVDSEERAKLREELLAGHAETSISILNHASPNRNLRMDHMLEIKEHIEEDDYHRDWFIGLNKRGLLEEGFHRCVAGALSKCSFYALLLTLTDREVDLLDRTRPRTAADIYNRHHFKKDKTKDGGRIQSAARYIYRVLRGRKPSTDEVVDTMNKYQEHLLWAARTFTRLPYNGSSRGALAIYQGAKKQTVKHAKILAVAYLKPGTLVRAIRHLDPEGADVRAGTRGVIFHEQNFYKDGAGPCVMWMTGSMCSVYDGDVKVIREVNC